MTDRSFAARKAQGTAAELALVDLLTANGATVIHHQAQHDGAGGAGPALARTRDGKALHLPDLSVIWPSHPMSSFAVEVKFKPPLPDDDEGWCWDMEAFTRAMAWARETGRPVLLALRDPRLAPLPSAGVLDDPKFWRIASLAKLLISSRRAISRGFNIWPDCVFSGLDELLTAQIGLMQLPHFRHTDSHPPRLF